MNTFCKTRPFLTKNTYNSIPCNLSIVDNYMNQETQNKTKVWMLIVSALLTSISILIYLGFNFTVPSFAEVFKGFGAELPKFTAFFLSYYSVFICLSLLGVIPTGLLFINRDIEPQRRTILFSTVIISFCISCVMQVLLIYSMYLPIMTMGETV